MEILLTDDLSLWDSVEGATTDYLGLDCEVLHNDWKNKENLITEAVCVGERVEEPLANAEEQLFLDELELDQLVDESAFANWMEDKFDFDECNMTFNSLEDVEMLLRDNEYEQNEKTKQPDSEISIPSYSEENSITEEVENSITEEEENSITEEENVSQEIPEPLPVTELNFGRIYDQPIVINLVVAGDDISDGEMKTRRERGKPYSKNKPTKRKAVTVETKKSRKRHQNRDAATRYRMKKKEEADSLLEEEEGLMAKNEELSKKVENLSSEINYLKGLMKELIQAKRN